MNNVVSLFDYDPRTIVNALIRERGKDFHIHFDDGSTLTIVDNMSLCCETRWIDTDDNLNDILGAKLLGIDLKESGGDRRGDIQFVEIRTTEGSVILKNYNEHNGYYSGWDLAILETDKRVRYIDPLRQDLFEKDGY